MLDRYNNLNFVFSVFSQYFRDGRTRNSRKCHNHYTGRFCTVKGCKGKLCKCVCVCAFSIVCTSLRVYVVNARKTTVR